MRLTAAFLLLAVTAAAAQSRSRTGSSASSTSLDDPTLNMRAATLSYPAGWQGEGAIDRSSPCSRGEGYPHFRVSNQAEGAFIIHLMPFVTVWPQAAAGNTNLSGCGAVSPLNQAAAILARLIVPQYTRGLQAAQVSRPEPIPNAGSGDTARVHISYTENGQPREEYILAFTSSQPFPGGGGGTTNTAVTIVSAPQGRLENAANVANNLGMNMNPQWQQANNRMQQQQMQASSQQNDASRNAILGQANANMAATQRRTQATIDSIHATGNASMNAARANSLASHNAAVGTAGYVGDKATGYAWRNTVTGATTFTQTNASPGPNWVPNN